MSGLLIVSHLNESQRRIPVKLIGLLPFLDEFCHPELVRICRSEKVLQQRFDFESELGIVTASPYCAHLGNIAIERAARRRRYRFHKMDLLLWRFDCHPTTFRYIIRYLLTLQLQGGENGERQNHPGSLALRPAYPVSGGHRRHRGSRSYSAHGWSVPSVETRFRPPRENAAKSGVRRR